MSVYVTSDLHGFSPERFRELLKKCRFSDSDFLFVLGDVIDRNGDGGIGFLRWMMLEPNIELIKGNHEKMMLDSSFVFEAVTEESVDRLSAYKMESLSLWMANGGGVTLKSLDKVMRSSPETAEAILDYCREAPLYESLTVEGRKFVLVHAGLGGFAPERELSDYSDDELLWTRPDPRDRYFEDRITVFGHTPTVFFGEEYKRRAFRTPTWINIDTGAAAGWEPMILRLDDLKEFYL